MAACSCAEERYRELDTYMDSLPANDDVLLSVLHKAQHLYGFIPPEVQEHIAQKMKVPVAKVYGVVTFYSFFKTEPNGQFNVNVCLGTACFVRGSQDILEQFEKQLNLTNGHTTTDGKFSLSSIRCIGACGLAPVVMVNERVYGRVKPEDVKKIIQDCRAEGGED